MILLGLLSEHMLKFIFSKKATKIDKIFTVDRRLLHSLKLTVKISSIFVTFLENMNFILGIWYVHTWKNILGIFWRTKYYKPYFGMNFDTISQCT